MASEQRRAFISYSRINKEFATKLTKGLRSAGYPVWFDQLDIPTGARWDDEVEKALRECNIFMVILTPASITSENVKDEIGYAIDRGKRILPVLLEDCDVPLRLRRFQYVDFTTKSFEEGFESAKELLKDLIEEASTPLPAKPPMVESPVESESEPLKAKPAPAMPVAMKAETVSATTQKPTMSKGLMIGIVAAVMLVIAVIGILARSNSSSNNPPVDNSAPANCSLNGDEAISVDVVNDSGIPLDYYWVGYDCTTEYYGTIDAGASITLNTFVTNVWQFIDPQTGDLHLEYTVASGDTSVSVP